MARGYIFTFASIDQNTVMDLLAALSGKRNPNRSNMLSSMSGASILFIRNAF